MSPILDDFYFWWRDSANQQFPVRSPALRHASVQSGTRNEGILHSMRRGLVMRCWARTSREAGPAHIVNKMEDEVDGLTILEDDLDAILDVLEDEESLQEEFSAAVSSVSAESKQSFNS